MKHMQRRWRLLPKEVGFYNHRRQRLPSCGGLPPPVRSKRQRNYASDTTTSMFVRSSISSSRRCYGTSILSPSFIWMSSGVATLHPMLQSYHPPPLNQRNGSTRQYHELSYSKNGKPRSCLEYYCTASTTTISSSSTAVSTTQQLQHWMDEMNGTKNAPATLDVFDSKKQPFTNRNDDDDHHAHDGHPNSCPPAVVDHIRWVLVEMIAAPWNPADVLSVQGYYPSPYDADDHDDHHHHPYHTENEDNNHDTAMRQQQPQQQLHAAAVADLVRRSSFLPHNTVPGSEGWGRVMDIRDIPWNDTTGTTTANMAGTTTLPETSIQRVSGCGSSSSTGNSIHINSSNNDNNTTTIQIGDYVVPGQSGLGTLRSSFWVPAHSLIRIHRGQELYDACGPYLPASLFQTGGTALRMLQDFVSLRKGDVVVQNAGNSAVGFMVSQIAVNLMQCHCVSVIRSSNRSHEQWIQLQQYLQEHGKASMVLSEESISDDNVVDISNSTREQLRRTFDDHDNIHRDASNSTSSVQRIRLALNAVGGSSANRLVHMLQNGGTVVSYGAMSKQPITIDTSQFIFRNIHLTGYWHSRWMVQQQHHNNIENKLTTDLRLTMMNELVDAVLDGKLECPPVNSFQLADFQNAFAVDLVVPSIRRKVVFDCRETNTIIVQGDNF
jgi:mitochondrial enoyl-[acyl-carrier protein] reductase / trans-2-enoyl-CoA reductase